MKTDKICISKKVSFFVVGGIILISFILLASFIGKTQTSSNTRAATPQCIYETMQDCKADGCTGLCTKGGCDGGMLYQCKAVTVNPTTTAQVVSPSPSNSTNETCVLYGAKFLTTSKGICWSIGSKPYTWYKDNPHTKTKVRMFSCLNELAKNEDESKCPAPTFCDSTYTDGKPAPWNTFLMETYIGGTSCSGRGIEVSGTEYGFGCNIIGPESMVDNAQCNLDTYSCDGKYEIVEGKCYNLKSRKCSYMNSGFETPACCSDVINMSFCL